MRRLLSRRLFCRRAHVCGSPAAPRGALRLRARRRESACPARETASPRRPRSRSPSAPSICQPERCQLAAISSNVPRPRGGRQCRTAPRRTPAARTGSSSRASRGSCGRRTGSGRSARRASRSRRTSPANVYGLCCSAPTASETDDAVARRALEQDADDRLLRQPRLDAPAPRRGSRWNPSPPRSAPGPS